MKSWNMNWIIVIVIMLNMERKIDYNVGMLWNDHPRKWAES
jgi:hypothetical protein